MKNKGRQRAKTKRKIARRKENKHHEEFGTIVKRKGRKVIALD